MGTEALWRSGDRQLCWVLGMLDLSLTPFGEQLYYRVWTRRNRRMWQQIRKCPDEQPTVVIVGAAHLWGPTGLVALAVKQGASVKVTEGLWEAFESEPDVTDSSTLRTKIITTPPKQRLLKKIM